MSVQINLARRIKKHMIARDHTYFAVTGPGLEDLCHQELQAPPLSIANARMRPGGVLFQGRLHELYGANLHLRTATRVLLRVAHIRASGFEELERQVAQIPWELYLPGQAVPQVQATMHKCRLYHSGAVKARVAGAIEARWRQIEDPGTESLPETTPPTIFVRGVDDSFTLSLDSSGDPLYLRGLKTQGGRAPLRETLAAAVLLRAGYQPDMILLDPMTGTGTFALEAALMAARIPPGMRREFAFQQWPAFQPGRWRHLRRQAAEDSVPPPEHPSIYALDQDASGCQALETRLEATELTPRVHVATGDFFRLTPHQVAQYTVTDTPGLIALNPPYGRRLSDPQSSSKLYRDIGRHLKQHFSGWRLALVIPPQIKMGDLPFQGDTHPLHHGGLRLKLLVAQV